MQCVRDANTQAAREHAAAVSIANLYRANQARRKMLAVKAQHPELDIRFVFQRNNTLSKQSKTTYGAWADKHGFKWCIFPDIPTSWLKP